VESLTGANTLATSALVTLNASSTNLVDVGTLTVNSNMTYSLNHSYTQRGVFVVNFTISDGVGLSSSGSFLFNAHRFLPTPSSQLVTINDGSAQRSMVDSITVSFADIENVGANAITVATSGGQSVPISNITRVYNGQTVVLVQFTGAGLIGGSLADGRYVISIDGSQIHNQQGAAYNGGSVITQQHLSPAQIVVEVHEPRFLPLCRFNQLFSLCSVAFLDFDCP